MSPSTKAPKKAYVLSAILAVFAASCGSGGGSTSPDLNANLTAAQMSAASTAVGTALGTVAKQQASLEERAHILFSGRAPHFTPVSQTVPCDGGGTMTITGHFDFSETGSFTTATYPITLSVSNMSLTMTATNCVTTQDQANYTINSAGITLSGNESITIGDSQGDSFSASFDFTESGAFSVDGNSCTVDITADASLSATTTNGITTTTVSGGVSGTACGSPVDNTISETDSLKRRF